jgi:hypothetical protein
MTAKNKTKKSTSQRGIVRKLTTSAHDWWKAAWWHKALAILLTIVLLLVATAYGISYWYAQRHADQPLEIGVTFIPNYARQLEVDPQETMEAMIHDLGIRRFRLVSYWKDIEPTPGQFNFDELDWQFRLAEENDATVSLGLGLRQPRWPECHGPEWINDKPMSEWQEDKKVFMGRVIERYKDSPALESYQLENEFFMSVFGICPDHSRERLIDAYEYVKQQDPDTPVIITRSNNWIGVPIGDPRPDQFGISIYKRVWDTTFTYRYFEYPLPPWFYGFLAGAGEIFTGRTLIAHELQAESWLPTGMDMNTAPVSELYKSMNPDMLADRIQYGVDTGLRTIDLWGAEWWYSMKVNRDEPGLWETAKTELARHREQ